MKKDKNQKTKVLLFKKRNPNKVININFFNYNNINYFVRK